VSPYVIVLPLVWGGIIALFSGYGPDQAQSNLKTENGNNLVQEIEQVFPGLVQDAAHPTKDGICHKVLKASVLVPILTKALQEANTKIDALTARVAKLEK